ncbi:MAG: hypothetical protein KAJ07_12950 [Planctomycetes bacterium]|nr:hypothetical protein [Planctomycetota bacterium]
MIQCKDCEFCEISEKNEKTFKCDPFSNIKEPECVSKWQLLRLNMLCAQYSSMLGWYQKMSPMQSKIFKYIQREIDDIDESDKWKTDDQDDDPSANNGDYFTQ